MQLNTTRCVEAWNGLYFIEEFTYQKCINIILGYFSILMMMKVRHIRVASITPEGCMDGLIPITQVFHKEMLLLQVTCQCLSLMLLCSITTCSWELFLRVYVFIKCTIYCFQYYVNCLYSKWQTPVGAHWQISLHCVDKTTSGRQWRRIFKLLGMQWRYLILKGHLKSHITKYILPI